MVQVVYRKRKKRTEPKPKPQGTDLHPIGHIVISTGKVLIDKRGRVHMEEKHLYCVTRTEYERIKGKVIKVLNPIWGSSGDRAEGS